MWKFKQLFAHSAKTLQGFGIHNTRVSSLKIQNNSQRGEEGYFEQFQELSSAVERR